MVKVILKLERKIGLFAIETGRYHNFELVFFYLFDLKPI